MPLDQTTRAHWIAAAVAFAGIASGATLACLAEDAQHPEAADMARSYFLAYVVFPLTLFTALEFCVAHSLRRALPPVRKVLKVVSFYPVLGMWLLTIAGILAAVMVPAPNPMINAAVVFLLIGGPATGLTVALRRSWPNPAPVSDGTEVKAANLRQSNWGAWGLAIAIILLLLLVWFTF